MSTSDIKILSEEEYRAVREAMIGIGARAFEQKPKTAAYLAEYFAENGKPLRAYGYLLQGIRCGLKVPSDVLAAYEKKARALSDDEVRMDYEGALMVGKELRETDFRGAAYYLCNAADSVNDKYGVAALIVADFLSSDPRLRTQIDKYYALAAQKGNPDLPPFERDETSRNRRYFE